MDELFNLLSSSARIDKSKRKRPKAAALPPPPPTTTTDEDDESDDPRKSESDRSSVSDSESESGPDSDSDSERRRRTGGDRSKPKQRSRDRTGKRDTSRTKADRVAREEASAFRRRMGIRLSASNRHDDSVPFPMSSFGEMRRPAWWRETEEEEGTREGGGGGGEKGGSGKKGGRPPLSHFDALKSSLLRSIESGRWVDPTPIQMQSVPSLLERRDVLGCAPTGSGKTGAFAVPALMIAGATEEEYFGKAAAVAPGGKEAGKTKGKKKGGKKQKTDEETSGSPPSRAGQIRTLLLAPSLELASQLHREVVRLGEGGGRPGGLRSALLSKSNASLISSGQAGGKRGLDVLVATPLRLVDCLEKGLDLGSVRLVVLDEADRLLDCADGGSGSGGKREAAKGDDESSDEEDKEGGGKGGGQRKQSGSAQSKTFLEQIDSILHSCPPGAVRALFSATMGPSVRRLSESVLRDPVDVSCGSPNIGGRARTSGAAAASGPSASSDIDQRLTFVGREEGKLLALRQLFRGGGGGSGSTSGSVKLRPPALVFVQSKERAQSLFGELVYDGLNVDVIHAGRSHAARDASVAKFRRGDTWLLVCTDLVARGVDFKHVNAVVNFDLPTSGVTYVHRIGRTGRAGRKGTAVTLFTEDDFENMRPVANVMKLSGCDVPEWILSLGKSKGGGRRAGVGGGGGAAKGRGKGKGKGGGRRGHHGGAKERAWRESHPPRRGGIDTTPGYDKEKRGKRRMAAEESKKRKKKSKVDRGGGSGNGGGN